MLRRVCWCCVLWLGWTAAAHAQTACPPGLIPYATGQGGGVAACGPDPSYNQQSQQPMSRPPRWADQWGALASDDAAGILGVSKDMPTKRSAEDAAMAECKAKGGTKCRNIANYQNECAAMVVGHAGYRIFFGKTTENAIASGMKTCNAENSGCHVYYSACSDPIRIQ